MPEIRENLCREAAKKMAINLSGNAVHICTSLTDEESAYVYATGISIVLFSLLGYCSGVDPSNVEFSDFGKRFQEFLKSEQDRI